MMKKIHNSHLGVNGCLSRALECLYWPGMTGDIKNHVSTCEPSSEYERNQTKEIRMSHEIPSRPWQHTAADICEFNGKHYLVTSDFYRDFFELDDLTSTTAVHVIKKLKGTSQDTEFLNSWSPTTVHSSLSENLQHFPKIEWAFKLHLTNSPHHSQANGKAESAVKEAKKILKKCKKANSD